MDPDSELLVAYLRSRPPRAFIPWVSPQFASGRPWSTHRIDIKTVDVDAPGRRWAWTIVGPDDAADECDPEETWSFQWPHDLDVVEIWETPLPPLTAQQFMLELALRRAETDSSELALAREEMIVHPGWSSDAVSAALKNWSHVHAGRSDLHFFWDDITETSALVAAVEHSDSPLLRHLRAAIEEDAEPKVILRRILDEF